ncbi:MAG: DNA-binding protein [Oscillospiraceae bacterium]|nr:DNA-binding protein [Oscillospiraceae bacterium]
MKEHAFRLQRGDDLNASIEQYVAENKIKAGVILSCVGSLYRSAIRGAGKEDSTILEKAVEIVSMTGTLSPDSCHIHISISDAELKTYGGHLKDGCLVNTTAEIVLLELDTYHFTRELDDKTGYDELVIKKLTKD